MIIMILMSLLVIKTKIMKLETLKLFFDVTIFIIFMDLYFYVGIENKDQLKNLFWVFTIYSMIFIIYNLSNYILINREKLIGKINKNNREVIKKIFMKPIVFKLVYYGIWMLPWNVAYYVYFWWMEYGWYLRVWVNSTRDIILWKLFKWDSREFFFNFFGKEGYKNLKKIYNRIRIILYRIILGMYYIRKNFLKTTIKEFIKKRIIIFMYLNIYYNYILYELQSVNIILFIIFIFIEIILFLFIGEILAYIYTNFYKQFFEILNKYDLEFYILWIIDPIENYTLVTEPYITKNTIWDITLSNSVSLNILYRWMIYVNNNTEGYYYYKMNIKTNIVSYRINKHTKESIIWDILPRTRYVIISLKYNYIDNNFLTFPFINELQENKNIDNSKKDILRPDFRIEEKKNLYLSFFEKTYNGNSSLLLLIWVLRNNFAFYDLNFKVINYITDENIDKNSDKFFNVCYNYLNYRILINMECLLKINKDNKYLLPDEILLRIYNTKFRIYVRDLESFVLFHIFNKEIEIKKYCKDIPDNYVGIKKYKEIFELMGYMTLNEEEGIIWNNDLQKTLIFFNLKYNFKLYEEQMEFYLNNVKNYYYLYWNDEFWETNKNNFDEINDLSLIEDLLNGFKISFNKNIELNETFFDNIKNIKIIDYGILDDEEYKDIDIILRIKLLNYILSKISINECKYNYIDNMDLIYKEEEKKILEKYK